jgi:hypothetical protein
MYRYYKCPITGKFVTMFDNKLIGAVYDKTFDLESDAQNRVKVMNEVFKAV